MKTTARVLLLVGIASLVAASPVAFVASGMRMSWQAVALAVGAALAAVLWLWALVSVGAVRRLSFGVGALIGFLSFAVVAAVFMLQPSPGYGASWRVAFFGWVLVAGGLYPVVMGGLLGHIFRKASVAHAL
jgi:hypothetical protein